MKKLFILSLGLLALIPVVSGTVSPADASAASMVQNMDQSADLTPELVQALQAQAASGSLSRPL